MDKKYKLANGDVVTISPEEEIEFLEKNQDAVLVIDDEENQAEEVVLPQENPNEKDKLDETETISGETIDIKDVRKAERKRKRKEKITNWFNKMDEKLFGIKPEKNERLPNGQLVWQFDSEEPADLPSYLLADAHVDAHKEELERKSKVGVILDDFKNLFTKKDLKDEENSIEYDVETNTFNDIVKESIPLEEVVVKAYPLDLSSQEEFLSLINKHNINEDMSSVEYLESIEEDVQKRESFVGRNLPFSMKFKKTRGGKTKEEWKEETGSNVKWKELGWLNDWYKNLLAIERRDLQDFNPETATPRDLATFVVQGNINKHAQEYIDKYQVHGIVPEMSKEQYSKKVLEINKLHETGEISNKQKKRQLKKLYEQLSVQGVETLLTKQEKAEAEENFMRAESDDYWSESEHADYIQKELTNDFALYWAKKTIPVTEKMLKKQNELEQKIRKRTREELLERYKPEIDRVENIADQKSQMLKSQIEKDFKEEFGQNGERCESEQCQQEVEEYNELLNAEIQKMKVNLYKELEGKMSKEYLEMLEDDTSLAELKSNQVLALKKLEGDMWQRYVQEWKPKYDVWNKRDLKKISKELSKKGFNNFNVIEQKLILEKELDRHLKNTPLTGDQLDEYKKEYWAYMWGKITEDVQGEKTQFFYKNVAQETLKWLNENTHTQGAGYEKWGPEDYAKHGAGNRTGGSDPFYHFGKDEVRDNSIGGTSFDALIRLRKWASKNPELMRHFENTYKRKGIPHTMFDKNGELYYHEFSEVKSNGQPNYIKWHKRSNVKQQDGHIWYRDSKNAEWRKSITLKEWGTNFGNIDQEKIKKFDKWSINTYKGSVQAADFGGDLESQIFSMQQATYINYMKGEGRHYNMARRFAKETIQNPEKWEDMTGGAGGFGAFFKALTSLEGYQYMPVANSLVSIPDLLTIANISNIPDEKRTSLQKQTLGIYALNSQAQAQIAEISMAWNAGTSAGHSLSFIADMILSSGYMGIVKQTVKKSVKKGVKRKLGVELSEKGLLEFGSMIAATSAQTLSYPMIGRVVNASIQNMTPEMQYVFSDAGDDGILQLNAITGIDKKGKEMGLKEGDRFFNATLKGALSTASDLFTEQLGAYFPMMKVPYGSTMSAAVMKRMGWTTRDVDKFVQRFSISRFMRKHNLSTTSELVAWAKKSGGWHGILGEFMEEMINFPLSNIANGNKNIFEGIFEYNEQGEAIGFDSRSVGEVLISVAGMGMMFNTAGLASSIGKPKTFIQGKQVNELDENQTKDITQDIINELLEDGSIDSSDIDFIENIEWKNLSEDTKNKIVEKLNIEMTGGNVDYQVYDQLDKVLNGVLGEGAGSDIIQVQSASDIKAQVVEAEMDYINNMTNEESLEVEKIESEIEQIENEKAQVKNGKQNAEKSGVLKGLQNKLNELNNKKKNILERVREKVRERIKTKEARKTYKKTLKKIKDINEKNANNRIDIEEFSNDKDARNKARSLLYGIVETFTKNGKRKGFEDLNGNKITLSQEQIDRMESVLNEAQNSHGYIIASNVNETNELVETLENEIAETQTNVEKQNEIINNENSSKEQIKEAKKEKKRLEKEINLKQKDISRAKSRLKEKSIMVLNEEAAITKGGENVASHEFFHFFLRKTFDKHPEIAAAFGRTFMRHLASTDPRLIRNSEFRRRLNEYNDLDEAGQSEEAMALYLDGIANGHIVYNESIMQKIGSILRHIARRFGINLKLKDGKDIANFLKDFNANIQRGELSAGMIKSLNEGLKVGGEIAIEVEGIQKQTESTINQIVQEYKESYPDDKSTDEQIRKKVTELFNNKDDIKFSKAEYNRAENTFDKHIAEGIITNKDFLNNQKAVEGVFTEIFVNKELDGLMANIIAADINIGGLAKNIQEAAKEDLKIELWRKIQNEYSPFKIENGKPVGDFRSLFSYIYGPKESKGLGGALFYSVLNIKEKYAKDVIRGAAPLEVQTSEGLVTREIEDAADTRQVQFEDVDILAQERAERKAKDKAKKKKTTKDEIRGKLIENELEFSSTTKTNIVKTVDKIKYKIEGKTYKDIKNDVVRQMNPNVNTKNQVDPTGVFYPVIESISQKEFGVDPKAVIAKRQNLTVPESNSSRTKIAKDAKRLGPKKYIKSILGPFAQTPTGQAIGIPPTLLRDFYKKGPRVPNIKGHALNIDNMSNEQILASFGINKDYSLMPHNRKFDGPIKGIITQSSVLAANQAVRVAKVEEVKQNNPGISTVEAQKVVEGAEISIGKPDVMFSKAINKSNIDKYSEGVGDILTAIGDGSVNFRDKNQVKTLLQDIYGKGKNATISAKEIRDTAEEISKWASKWEGIQDKKARLNKKQIKELDVSISQEMEMDFRDYFIRNTENAFLEKKLFDMLGEKIPPKYKSFNDIYNDKSRIIKARATVPALITHMITSKKEGGLGLTHKEAITIMLKYGQGMYASAGKIHDSRWTIRKNKTGINSIITNNKNPNGKGTPRGQVFDNVADFISAITSVKELGLEGLTRSEIITKLDIDTKTLKDSSAAVLKNINKNGEASTFKTSKKQAKEAQEFISIIGSFYGNKINEGSLDYVDLAMLNKMFLSNMQAPLRKAANVAYLSEGVKSVAVDYLGSLYEYEHMVPASVKSLEIMESIINTGKVDNSLFDNYQVAIIPSAMNDALTENGMRNFMPIGWKKGDPSFIRYYNSQTLGDKRLVAIRSIDPKDKGKINPKIQTFIDISKVFNKDVVKRNKDILQIATFKKSKSVGMSTFDFDDTLAKTKSGVRVTMPNIDGKPKPKKKVIFLAGGAGSGKSNVVKKLRLQEMGMKIVNQDISLEWLKKNHGLPEDMRDLTKEQRSILGKLGHQARGIAKRKMMKFQGQGDGVVVDGTGASAKNMQKLVDEFKAKGYDVGMIFVETSLETSLARNKARKERSLLDVIVRKNHEAVMSNKSTYAQLFGDRFMEVNTDNLALQDAMPQQLVDKANDFISGYEKLRLDAEQFAERGAEILEKGGKFDFSEFNDVVDGTPGPLLDKAKQRAQKHGTKDIFVLTARPAESAQAIQNFLKSQGLNIPLKNITGLGNSTGNAKARWMLEKFAEGYNDMYFVDDAIQNVEAVKEVLDQLDVKSEVVQAKVKFSKTASNDFNDMLERSAPDIKSDEVISDAGAKIRARKLDLMQKLKLNIFIPPSAEDFKGLLYNFLGKGKQGEQDLQFFKDNLLVPYAKANRVINNTKQKMSNEYADLKKNAKDVNLKENVQGTDYNVDTAIRVYLWSNGGFEIPGLSQQDQLTLVDKVKNNPALLAFAEGLSGISRMKDGYIKPSNNWFVENISWDLNNIANIDLRNEFLQEWKNNKDIIFSKENLNKIEAIYGSGFREALENILYRMEHGKNRLVGKDSVVNGVLDWINGSVGATMFFNMRSAILQTISTVNFINFEDNNPLAASKAFANQKQFWKDFSFIFNSDMLKQRRAGLQIDVSASELGNAFDNGGRSVSSIIGYLLQQGFTPTRIADSFAIAFGGASFYRNRFNKYTKQGMSEIKAKEQAFLDFQEIAEETQQSSRPDLISQEQAGVLGRIVLAWQNTPMQMTRLTKKAISDLANGRGSVKSNVSKIIYYGAIQNLIFGTLQSGLMWAMFGDDDEEIKKKEIRVANGMLDTLLRGTGIYGAGISTLKNTLIKWKEQEDKPFGRREDWRIVIEMMNISPPVGSKLRKIMNAVKTDQYNKGVGDKLGLRVENPNLRIAANVVEATTNIPAARVLNKANNLEEAFTGQMKLWQRAALTMGWSMWDVGIRDEELEQAKEEVRADRKKQREIDRQKKKEEKDKQKAIKKQKEEDDKKKKGIKTVQCSGIRSDGQRCKLTTETNKKTWKCTHHMEFKDGMDRDGDGLKEYRCTATTSSGNRCKNKTENKNKKCYAHQ